MGTVREFRLSEGFLTIEDMAKKLGVCRGTLENYISMGIVGKPQHSWRGSVRNYYKAEELFDMEKAVAALKVQHAKAHIKRCYRVKKLMKEGKR